SNLGQQLLVRALRRGNDFDAVAGGEHHGFTHRYTHHQIFGELGRALGRERQLFAHFDGSGLMRKADDDDHEACSAPGLMTYIRIMIKTQSTPANVPQAARRPRQPASARKVKTPATKHQVAYPSTTRTDAILVNGPI